MRNESHKTFLQIIKAAVIEWRKREGWSRETVVQAIVEEHEKRGGPRQTGIRFEPSTTDAFDRQKVNADRVFRWLDDETKDTNFMPPNFFHSVLAAMPMDIRLHCAGELIRPLGLTVHIAEHSSTAGLNATMHLITIAKETSEAQCAIAALIDGVKPAELVKAERELAEAEEAIHAARIEISEQLVEKR